MDGGANFFAVLQSRVARKAKVLSPKRGYLQPVLEKSALPLVVKSWL